MSEYTPTTENIRQTFAYVQAGLDDDDGYPFVMHVHVEAFDRWLAEERRAAAEKAWDNVRAEIRGIPHWANPETGQGGFDLQPLGPNESSEEGAFMEVMRVLAENPYRTEEVAPDGR